MKEKTKANRKNLHDDLAEARSKRGKSADAPPAPVTHRITTHKPNGAESQEVAPEKVPIGEAMRRAVEALGDVVINDELAPRQLRELGDCYEEVTRRQAAFNARNEEAKTAKKSLDSAQELLLEKVRSFTHPKPLPLFDRKQAESDRAAMTAGGDAEHVEDAKELGVSEATQ